MSSNKIDTKTRILEATWLLMEQRRGQGVSMSDIAKQAGISRQALYLHFDSRVELMIATVQYVDQVKGLDERLQQFQQAQSGLSSALSKLLVTFERYPELKANENFKELINELERTENRINVERNRYNEAIRPYNQHIKTFPNNVINKFIGKFEEMDYFKSDEGSEKAPKVDFDFGKK